MLKILRNKKTAKKVWITLAVIVIPAFALWGFGEAFLNKDSNAVIGKINGRKISSLEFKNALSGVRTLAIMRFGDKFSEVEKYLNLEAQAWERLVLLYEAKKRRITASDKEVIDIIQDSPYFKDKNGFSDKIYTTFLRYVFQLQARQYEEHVRNRLIINKLYDQITKNISLSDEEILYKYLKENQEIKIRYIAALYSDFEKDIKPTENEIINFFEKNKTLFKAPPAPEKPAAIPELAEVKDKVRDFLIKERTKKAAEDKINECVKEMKILDFTKAAKSCGLKSKETAFFRSTGQIDQLGYAEIFWDTAKKLKKNEVSRPISNEKGFYIIELSQENPIDDAKFKKEKNEFNQRLLLEKKDQVFSKFAEELLRKAR